ncbi:uncharacterized protein C1orf105 homolog isoform X1 [Bos taurus]|uniref:uncharacterized protein C1orf105 homolog isoform X1 n=1 Tax=Bos taurus TaxID=9913 RepID=UPI000572EADC|nr:uncharacterized protein C1orf105 homolog isoform X1 [Bos taurus]
MKCILNICQKNPTWCILYSPQTPSNASPKCISWKSPAKVTLGARRSTPHAIQVYSPSSCSAQLAGRQERVKAQAGWNQNDPTLIRNKQLCSTCRGVKMVQPKTLIIPDDRKLSFANIMNHRMMSLHQPKAQTVPKRSRDDILTENVHYRLPILGPRTAVFHRLLSDAYETLQETQLSSLPSKEPVSKAVSQ